MHRPTISVPDGGEVTFPRKLSVSPSRETIPVFSLLGIECDGIGRFVRPSSHGTKPPGVFVPPGPLKSHQVDYSATRVPLSAEPSRGPPENDSPLVLGSGPAWRPGTDFGARCRCRESRSDRKRFSGADSPTLLTALGSPASAGRGALASRRSPTASSTSITNRHVRFGRTAESDTEPDTPPCTLSAS